MVWVDLSSATLLVISQLVELSIFKMKAVYGLTCKNPASEIPTMIPKIPSSEIMHTQFIRARHIHVRLRYQPAGAALYAMELF